MSTAIVDDAYAFLRAHTKGDLRFDEHFRPLAYVVSPSGRLVAPVMAATLQTMDTVLFVPEAVEGSLELQVTLTSFREDGTSPSTLADDVDEPSGGALADRWRIHHGDPPDVNWARFDIDAARFRDQVIDGDGLQRPNPLGAGEAGLCREMNRDRVEDLRLLCRRIAQLEVEKPVMVAIDPLGLDVRGRFEVVRIPVSTPMGTIEEARREIDALIERARSAETSTDTDG